MGERDPGNKPRSNDRIPYVYKKIKRTFKEKTYKNGNIKKIFDKLLQGDRIEHVDYVKEHPDKCKIDYQFYITNQIRNSVIQVLDLPVNTDTGTTAVTIDKNATEIFNLAADFYDKKDENKK